MEPFQGSNAALLTVTSAPNTSPGLWKSATLQGSPLPSGSPSGQHSFFSFLFKPRFYPDSLMCVGLFRKTGKAYIRKILQHDTPKGFLSSVIAEVIDPFGIENVNESSCLSSSLSINPVGNFYKLTLQLQCKYNNISLMASKNEKLPFEKTVHAHL